MLMWIYVPPDTMQWEGHNIFVLFFPQSPSPQSNWENSRQTQVEGHYTKHMTSILQKWQGHVKQGKTKELSQTGQERHDN